MSMIVSEASDNKEDVEMREEFDKSKCVPMITTVHKDTHSQHRDSE